MEKTKNYSQRIYLIVSFKSYQLLQYNFIVLLIHFSVLIVFPKILNLLNYITLIIQEIEKPM